MFLLIKTEMYTYRPLPALTQARMAWRGYIYSFNPIFSTSLNLEDTIGRWILNVQGD